LDKHTAPRLESFISKEFRSARHLLVTKQLESIVVLIWTYRNEIPYCETVSKLDFQTSVTSQALVADNLHDRKAETALPPTVLTNVSFQSGTAGKQEIAIRDALLDKGLAGYEGE